MAITFPQQTTFGTASATSPVTQSFSSQLPVNGNAVFAAFAITTNFAPGAITGVTDNQGKGNVWQIATGQPDGDSGNLGRVELWFCPSVAVSSLPFTVSAAYSGTQNAQAALLEVNGLIGTIDQVNGAGATSGTSLVLSNSAVNASALDLVIAFILLDNYTTSAALSSPATSGYTVWGTGIGIDGGRPCQASYKVVSATETSQATWSWTGSEQYAALIGSFPGTIPIVLPTSYFIDSTDYF